MDAIAVVRGLLKRSHEITEQAVADLTPEQLHHRGEGSNIDTIAVIYTHVVTAEDSLINGVLREQAPLFERAGWTTRVGIEMNPAKGERDAWVASIPGADFAALRQYAQDVYAETDEYLATLSEADLDRTVSFMGGMPAGAFLGSVMGWHATQHSGEICALKGVMGGKGLPF